ncbi:MAG: pyruvate, phosphate dikinase [Proteobacteria bacterium]|nr:pyruvate, phosphate dikinase [Pseudomonadota bacterium]
MKATADQPLTHVLDPSLAGRELAFGQKAAQLAQLADLALPVPDGFAISAAALRNMTEQIAEPLVLAIFGEVAALAGRLKRGFGAAENPLLLAIRTSAPPGVPNSIEAVLNVGLNDATVEALAAETGDINFAYESYRRFIQNFAHVVLGDDPAAFEDVLSLYKEERGYVSESELRGSDARELAGRFKAQFASNNGEEFPQDVNTQLAACVLALMRAWNAPRARTQRKLQAAREDASLAIIVQEMVFGNLGDDSGVGRAFSRNSQTGIARLSGEYLPRAQGPDLVNRLRQVLPLQNGDGTSLAQEAPAVFSLLQNGIGCIEAQLRDAIEAEFVIQQGKLSFLSAKPSKRSTAASLQIVIDFVNAGLLTREEALLRIDPLSLDQLLHSTIDPDVKRTVIASGLPASPGAVSGAIIFDAEEARRLAADEQSVILVRPETLPEDVRGLHAAAGVLTTRGGMTSHAAVIARGMGKPCVSGASSLRIDAAAGTLTAPGMTLKKGDIITLDGGTGQVLKGEVETRKPELSGNFATLLAWADEYRRMTVRANAETVQDARMARDLGAEGIGLCRTEHMFFEGDRIVAIREMILADRERDRRAALAKTLPMLRADFVELFEIMAGLPVTLRLLDPPLHEFLPEGKVEIEALARALGADLAALNRRIQDLREQNPMLGHRGVRLLLSYPEIVDMQARAVFEAVVEAARSTGRPPIPEIMVPLVASRAELDLVRKRIDAVAEEVQKESGLNFTYRVGTMIELPRAALRAGDIAQSAEFFSFGTNDLTQTTFGISRDDSARFIGEYTSKGIFQQDPFVTLDVEGVGELVHFAAERGRAARPGLHLGICGEHGGDPASINFCESLGLDYVSCSPYRVPIARLAAAQARLRNLR